MAGPVAPVSRGAPPVGSRAPTPCPGQRGRAPGTGAPRRYCILYCPVPAVRFPVPTPPQERRVPRRLRERGCWAPLYGLTDAQSVFSPGLGCRIGTEQPPSAWECRVDESGYSLAARDWVPRRPGPCWPELYVTIRKLTCTIQRAVSW